MKIAPAPKRHVKRAAKMSRCKSCGADKEPFQPCQFGCSQREVEVDDGWPFGGLDIPREE